MFVVKALTRGLVGFYLALSLLVSAGALSRIENPPEAVAFLEEARWVPGAARLEVALRDKMSGGPIVVPEPAGNANLTGLQKLRLRTYGDSN